MIGTINHSRHLKVFAIFLLFLGVFGLNFLTSRSDFIYLITCFFIGFAGFVLLLNTRFKDKTLFTLGLIMRVSLLLAPVVLSDDFYRYIWDGYLSSHAYSPYAFVPSSRIELNHELVRLMNSPDYYSVYPPAAQLFFMSGGAFFSKDPVFAVLGLRLFVIVIECVTFFFLTKLNKFDNINVVVYWLNPLVIVEFVMGIHVEFLMVMSLIGGYYYMRRYQDSLKSKYLLLVALFFAIAFLSKMWPLLFAPLLFREIKIKPLILVFSLFVLLVIGAYAVLYDASMFDNIGKSLTLYFKKFEFNQSFYFIAKYLNDHVYRNSLLLYRILLIASLSTVYYYYLIKRRVTFLEACTFLMLVYFISASVIHPWYLASVAILMVSNIRWHIVIWMMLIPLTYITYINEPIYEQNGWVILAEYLIVLGVFIYEVVKLKRNGVYAK